MHGMLSLAVLVAAFAGLAGWAGYLLVRLYRACPAARSTPAQAPEDDPADLTPAVALAEPPPAGDPAEEQATPPQPVT